MMCPFTNEPLAVTGKSFRQSEAKLYTVRDEIIINYAANANDGKIFHSSHRQQLETAYLFPDPLKGKFTYNNVKS